jgi:hypothetical protein
MVFALRVASRRDDDRRYERQRERDGGFSLQEGGIAHKRIITARGARFNCHYFAGVTMREMILDLSRV